MVLCYNVLIIIVLPPHIMKKIIAVFFDVNFIFLNLYRTLRKDL